MAKPYKAPKPKHANLKEHFKAKDLSAFHIDPEEEDGFWVALDQMIQDGRSPGLCKLVKDLYHKDGKKQDVDEVPDDYFRHLCCTVNKARLEARKNKRRKDRFDRREERIKKDKNRNKDE